MKIAYDEKLSTISLGPLPAGAVEPVQTDLRYSDDQPRESNGQFGSGGGSVVKSIGGAMEHTIGTQAMHALVRVGDKLLDKDGNKVTVKEKGEHTLKVYDHKSNDYKELAKSEVGSYTWGSRSEELRYAPDQPRDDHGRFGEGSGEPKDWHDIPKDGSTTLHAGPVKLTAYRTGELTDPGRGIFFGDSSKGIEPYQALHENAPIKAYEIEAKNVAIAPSAAKLYAELNPGKSFQDAVFNEDKKSGFKSSTNAMRVVEAKLAKQVGRLGMDAIVYTAPPAPAEREITVINQNTAKIKLAE